MPSLFCVSSIGWGELTYKVCEHCCIHFPPLIHFIYVKWVTWVSYYLTLSFSRLWHTNFGLNYTIKAKIFPSQIPLVFSWFTFWYHEFLIQPKKKNFFFNLLSFKKLNSLYYKFIHLFTLRFHDFLVNNTLILSSLLMIARWN